MKRIVRRVQSLNERAAELTAAASQLPKRVAEMREVMTATTGQLQSLKTDIQANVADLVIHREDDFAAALAEITSHAPVLAEAGFLLDGLDIEVSPTQRVVVQLVRIGDAEPGEIEELIQKHHGRTTLRAILSAMLKARDVAATIRIDGLSHWHWARAHHPHRLALRHQFRARTRSLRRQHKLAAKRFKTAARRLVVFRPAHFQHDVVRSRPAGAGG